MQAIRPSLLHLESEALELLAWNVPNEIINGFKVNDFDLKIGATKEQVKDLARKLRGLPDGPNVVLEHAEALILRNSLAVVIAELGEDEFHTRTGFDYDFGQRLFEKLDRFCNRQI